MKWELGDDIGVSGTKWELAERKSQLVGDRMC